MAKKIEMLNDRQQVVHPLTSSDCVIMENGKTLEEVMGDGIATPTVTHEGASFQVGVGDSNIEVVDGDVAGMTLEGQTYQNILPKPTTLIMETDEKEFKINDKIDNNIVLDDNVAEIATIKGQTYVNVVQEESATEYTVLGEELSGQSITTTGKPEGVIKNATLEGMTLVNTIQEPSEANSVVLDLDSDINSQTATINNTVQGGIHGAKLVGQTLVNVDSYYDKTSKYFFQTNADSISDDGYIQLTANGTWRNAFSKFNGMLKPSTQYLAIVDIKTNTLGDGSNPFRLFTEGQDASGTVNAPFVGQTIYLKGGVTGIFKYKLTTMSDLSTCVVNSRHYVSNTVTSGIIVFRYMLIEYQEGMENWDIDFFRGMQSVKMPVLKATGKNLFNFENGGQINGLMFSNNGANNYTVSGTCTKDNTDFYAISKDRNSGTFTRLNSLPIGTKIAVSKSSSVGRQVYLSITQKDGSPTKYVQTYTTTNNDNVIHCFIRFMNGDTFDNEQLNLQIEIGSTATSYEPYKANILSTPSDLELRGIGDVQDTLNCLTGEVVEVTEEIILSNKGWGLAYSSDSTGNVPYFIRQHLQTGSNKFHAIASDKLKVGNPFSSVEENIVTMHNGQIRVRLTNDINTLEKFNKIIDSLNISVCYELNQKVVKTVDLTIKDQDNNSLKTIQAQPTLTHITTSSNGLIPFVSIPSQLKYPTIIKPSTQYTLKLKRDVVDSVNQLTVNVGGVSTSVTSNVMTITTPDTLTSQDIVFTGKNNVISKLQLIEGDVTSIDYPFFEGMLDVKSPKLLATGKNLCYLEKGYINPNNGTDTTMDGAIRTNYIEINPRKRYYISGLVSEAKCFMAFYDADKKYITRTTGNNRSYMIAKPTDGSPSTPSNARYIRITNYGSATNEDLTLPIMVEQLDEGASTTYEAYKAPLEIEQSIDSIPLTSSMFEQNGYSFNSTSLIRGMSLQQIPLFNSDTRIKTKTLIKLKPNSTYTINADMSFSYACFNKDGNYLKAFDFCSTFTTDSETHYIVMNLRYADDSTITPSSLDSLNLTLQEVADEIVLRSIGDVKDTLNLTTGEYVQRIGEIVLDGSEGWSYNPNWSNGDYLANYTRFFTNKANGSYNILSDNVPTCRPINNGVPTSEFMCGENGGNVVYVCLRKDKLLSVPSDNINDYRQAFLEYLQSNPLTVQYELATPIIKKVNLINTTKLPSYTSTTHYDTIVPSNSLVPNIKIPSTIDYNVAIKPSIQYTIRANTTSAMSVNLGGSTGTLANGKVTLTTPSTLAHNSLKLGNGKAKEVMVIEGSEIKDNVPFFNGMKNVQMGGIKLVNIARHERQSSAITANTNKTQFTYTSNGANAYHAIYFDTSLLKTNTVYTVFADITTNTSDNVQPVKFQFGNASGDILDVTRGFVGKIKQTITSANTTKDGLAIVFRPCSSGGQVVIKNPMIIEGDWTHLDEIPFIESEMIIEQPIIRSQGKNLFDGNFIVGDINTTTGNYWGGTTWKATDYIKVKNKGKIVFSSSIAFATANFVIFKYDKDKKYIGYQGAYDNFTTATFNLENSVRYIKIRVPYDVPNNTNIQIEEGSTATTYEPFKHQTLYSNRVIGYEENCYYRTDGGVKTPNNGINSMLADVEGLSVAYVTGGSSNYTFWDKDDVFITGKQYLDTSLSSYDKNGFIAIPSNAKYMRFAAGGETNAQPLYKVATVTGELPLRSLPNGVCDSFNLVTGEYVQRVGEIVLDGTNLAKLINFYDHSKFSGASGYSVQVAMGDMATFNSYGTASTIVWCDKLKNLSHEVIDRTTQSGITTTVLNSTKLLLIKLPYDFDGSPSLDTFKQYISKNPITVQYELATPIVRKIGLTAKGNYKEVKLNGSENWTSLESSSITTVKTYFAQYIINDKNALNRFINIFNDKDFPTRSANDLWTNDIEGMSHNVNGYIQIRVAKDKLNTQDIDGFKRWLSQHPIKVGYISTTQSATTYSNILKPIFFNNVKVQFMNDNIDIQPSLTYQARTLNSYVMDMMKVNTRYTLKALKNSNSFTIDGTSYGAGTNGTFTSPSTLTNKLMITGQDVQELMIIEGDVTGLTIPYYKGIRSAYDNVDEIEVYSSNKNLFDMSKVEPYDETGINWWNTIIKENEVVSVRSGNVQSGQFGAYTTLNIKPNSVYTLYIEMEKDGEPFNGQIYVYENDKVWGNAKYAIYANTPYHINTSQNAKYITIGFNYGRDFPIGTTLVSKNMRLYLGKENPVYIPHQHNTTSFTMPTRLETVDVVRPIMEIGRIASEDGQDVDATNAKRSKDYIPVEPDMILMFMNGSSARAENVYLYGINKNYISAVYTNGTGDLIIPEDCYFIRIHSGINNTSDIKVVKQQYKPIALNSLPNGIKDEIIIDPVSNKAKLIQRVGKVVLDGFSGGHDETNVGYNFRKFVIYTGLTSIKVAGQCVASNNLPCIVSGDVRNTIRLAVDGKIVVNIEGFSDINEYFNYLHQNPITVYYELAEPVITEISLKGYPYVYKDGSVQLNTEIPHTTKVKYNVNQEHLINGQNETIIRHDKQIDNLYDYIELYLEEEYRMELFRMQLELSL